MLYVPVIPPHATPPSPRTRELSDLLGRVIEEYEKHHPAVTGSEVREAVRLAAMRSSRTGSGSVRILAGVSAAAAVAGIFAFVAANHGQVPGNGVPTVAVALALLAVLFVVVVVKRSGG